MSNLSHYMIIASGPHAFPGAGQIMSQNLRELSTLGCNVAYVGTKRPFLFSFMDDNGVRFKKTKAISSGAIGSRRTIHSQDVLICQSLAESMIEVALSPSSHQKKITLWGTYLYPYAYAALIAKVALSVHQVATQLWITPAGSDIWEIGPQLLSVTRWLLESPEVSRIITYTTQFANEIKKYYKMERKIEAIYPMLDFSRFHPISYDKRLLLRQNLGISETSFIITSHSNMRPVKRPEDVIYLAHSVAKRIHKNVVLFMIGPRLQLPDVEETDNLRIVWTGISKKPENFLWISDVELNCSWHDSFNLSLAEAMACGIPCVSTDVVGIGPEILNSKGGFLFPYEISTNFNHDRRYESAIEYIVSLALSEELRRQIAENSSKHALKSFSPDVILPKYLELLNE